MPITSRLSREYKIKGPLGLVKYIFSRIPPARKRNDEGCIDLLKFTEQIKQILWEKDARDLFLFSLHPTPTKINWNAPEENLVSTEKVLTL